VKFITYSTHSGKALFDLCYETFSQTYPSERLTVYCLDEEMFKYCSTLNVIPIKWCDIKAEQYQYWNLDTASIYQRINREKLKVVVHACSDDDSVLYFDADTLHLRDIRGYLQSLESGVYTSMYLHNLWCMGIIFIKQVDQPTLTPLLSMDVDDELLIQHLIWTKQLNVKSLDRDFVCNPNYGEVPDKCHILHYPGRMNLNIKIKLLNNALKHINDQPDVILITSTPATNAAIP